MLSYYKVMIHGQLDILCTYVPLPSWTHVHDQCVISFHRYPQSSRSVKIDD
jgi:hypothetical protein